MKNRILIILGIIGVTSFAIFSFQRVRAAKSKVEIRSMGDNKGVFIGKVNPQYKESDRAKWSEATRKRVEQHEADIKAIDDAHMFRMQANSYLKEDKLELAAEAFEKSYSSKKYAITGFDLVGAYEKLHRYDEAVTILDAMIQNRETNEYGIQKAQEIRTRLLAAKNSKNAA